MILFTGSGTGSSSTPAAGGLGSLLGQGGAGGMFNSPGKLMVAPGSSSPPAAGGLGSLLGQGGAGGMFISPGKLQ